MKLLIKKGNVFLLKNFFKNPKNCKTHRDALERKDAVNEFIIAGIYRYIMPDRAPREHLVLGNKVGEFRIKQQTQDGKILRDDMVPNKEMLYVRSKFFKDVIPMQVLMNKVASLYDPKKIDELNQIYSKEGRKRGEEKLRQDGFPEIIIKNGPTSLSQIKGFAKVMAGCIIGGEADYHMDNIMFSNKDNTYLKIDHGRSFRESYEDFSSFINATNINFKNFGFNDDIKDGVLRFDAKELADSLKQMTDSLTKEQMENMIDQKLSELKKVGFDPTGLKIDYRSNNITNNWQRRNTMDRSEYFIDQGEITIKNDPSLKDPKQRLDNSYKQLESYYKEFLSSSLTNTKEIFGNLEIVNKFSKAPIGFDLKKFKEGGWLEKMANFNCDIKDPVLFAAHNNILIEDKNPLIWVKENNYKIKQYKFDQREGKTKVAAQVSPLDYILEYKNNHSSKLSAMEKQALSQPIISNRFSLKNRSQDSTQELASDINKPIISNVKKLREVFMDNQQQKNPNENIKAVPIKPPKTTNFNR